jgi:hypothetical protein
MQPPGLSDHAFITVIVDLQFQHSRVTHSIRRRQWRAFDFDKFCHELSSSALPCNPPSDAVGLFTCYHNTLQSLVDKNAPFAVVRHHAHLTAPWYDHTCQMVKTVSRKLERIYTVVTTPMTTALLGVINQGSVASHSIRDTSTTGQ